MATMIRPEVSVKNRYWIDKHRYYELKHFCLQYHIWKRTYAALTELRPVSNLEKIPSGNTVSDPTAKQALRRAYYSDRIDMIESAAYDADNILGEYILRGVTEGLSYTYLKSKLGIPCSRDTYYDRYRKFFWLLDGARG